MATQTTNLNLTKPEMSDYANINDLNNNFEILDKAYGDLRGKYLQITGGTIAGDINSNNSTGLALRSANGMNNGATTFEVNANNNLYFNGGKLCTVFNSDYEDIKKIDVATKETMSELVQGEYSLQIFQDKQSLWTEMYVMVWNTEGDKWFKFKSPITWKNQESTFIVTSLGSIKSYHTFYENTCCWIDNNTFYMFSRGRYCQMYHFAGYAMTLFDQTNTADLFKIDEATERMTVQTNAAVELQSINTQLTELNAAATYAVDDNNYAIFKDGKVVTMSDDELNEYHASLVDRRAELIKTLQA